MAETVGSTIDLDDLSLKGLDERLRALRPVAHSGSYYDLDVKCPVVTENENGLMSSADKIKLAGLEKHPNLGPNELGNADFPNYTHDVVEIQNIQKIARTGLLSDLPGEQVASRDNNGLMSKSDFARLYDTHKIAHSGLFNDLEFNDNFKERINTTGYLATNALDGFMSRDDKDTFDKFFGQPLATRHNYVHLTGPGYNHIPSGGTSGQILQWAQGDTAVWKNQVTYNAGSYLTMRNDGEYNKIFEVITGTTSATVSRGDHNHDSRYLRLGVSNSVSSLDISSGGKTLSIGVGPNDVYMTNSASGRFLQLKDDGTLSYSDQNIYHTGNLNAASQSYWGLMSAEDKRKLDSVAWNATNFTYTHPASHPASMITGLANVAKSGSYNDLSNKPTWISGAGTADKIKISGTARTATVSGSTLAFS